MMARRKSSAAFMSCTSGSTVLPFALGFLSWSLTFPSALRAEDWCKFLGPRGDGTSSEKGIDPELWKPYPKINWGIPLGVSYGGPSLAQGKLLQFDRYGDQERLTCYEASTSKELWRWEAPVEYDDMYGYNNGPRCSPVVDDGLVFTYGVAGRLSCLEFETGKLLWTKDTIQEYGVVQNFFGVASTPCVFEEKLLVMVGGSTEESRKLPTSAFKRIKSNGSAVVAFDKRNGKELYRLGDELASYAALTVREIEGQPTGLAFLRGGLIGWDAATGKQLFDFPWRAPMLESVNAALPITLGNRIMLSEAYEVGSVLLEIADHKPSVQWQDGGPWSTCKFRAHWSTPIVVDGFIYGCNGRNQPDSDFRCVRFSDGEVQWTDRRHERSSVLWVDGYLIVLGEYGRLELMRPNPEKLDVVAQCDLSELLVESDGKPLVDYPCWAAPVLSDGKLYIRGSERLVCFELIPK
jgi:outer membrane protein assembly factor BamB